MGYRCLPQDFPTTFQAQLLKREESFLPFLLLPTSGPSKGLHPYRSRFRLVDTTMKLVYSSKT
jgi:hypothetical protein